MIKVTIPEAEDTKRLKAAIIEVIEKERALRFNEQIAYLPDTHYNRTRIPYMERQVLYEAQQIILDWNDKQ